MDCVACKLPIESFELETYDCTYNTLAQAAGNNCLTCSFVLECIRTVAADVRLSDIVKIDVLSDYYCELHLRTGFISLDIFTDGKLFATFVLPVYSTKTCFWERLRLFWILHNYQ